MKHSYPISNQPSESLILGLFLAFVGGFLDAYTYVARDHVFANAQTGNIVLLGINIMERNWMNMIYYLLPILAFILGVVIVEMIKSKYKKQESLIHWRQIIIAIEIFSLFIVAFIPIGSKNMIANVIISFVCSMQVESFRTIKGNSIATTMCTGNLRSATEKLYFGLMYKKNTSIEKSFHYFFVILSFLFGAILGAYITSRFVEKAILGACIMLLIVFTMMFAKEKPSS